MWTCQESCQFTRRGEKLKLKLVIKLLCIVEQFWRGGKDLLAPKAVITKIKSSVVLEKVGRGASTVSSVRSRWVMGRELGGELTVSLLGGTPCTPRVT